MARYDLYRHPDEDGYLLDVQASILGTLNTRVVVPLLRPDRAPKAARRLNPLFLIDARSFVMVTQFMSAFTDLELGEKVGNLSNHHDDIVAALDMLFQGF